MHDDLTDKQRAFIDHYVTCLNASEAARRAGYDTKRPDQQGYENLRKPEIRRAIDARLKDSAMSAHEVLTRLSDQAAADLGEFFTQSRSTFRLDLKKAKENGLLRLVKKYTKSKDGTVTIELYDAQAALALLAKHHGLLVDRTELSGPGGGPLLPPIREVVIQRDSPVDPHE